LIKFETFKDTITSFEQRLSQQHLCHDTTCRPDVHCNREQTSAFSFNLLYKMCLCLSMHSCWHNLWGEFTSLCVVHPVEDDLGRSVPARHHVASHLSVGLPRQAKIKNLKQENQNHPWKRKGVWDVHIKTALCELTFSSQSGLMAKFPGFRSCGKHKCETEEIRGSVEVTGRKWSVFSFHVLKEELI